jgi:hypothetical protein
VTRPHGAGALALAPCDDSGVPLARRIVVFAVISIFTLGLGVLALFDGIEMLAQAAGYSGNDRTALLGLGALTTVGSLVPIALWVLAGWAIFVKRQRWEW